MLTYENIVKDLGILFYYISSFKDRVINIVNEAYNSV